MSEKDVVLVRIRYILAIFLMAIYFHPWAKWSWKVPEVWELEYLWKVTKRTFVRDAENDILTLYLAPRE